MYGPPPSQSALSSSVTGLSEPAANVPTVLVKTNLPTPVASAASRTWRSPSTLVENNAAGSRNHILASTTQ